MASAGFTQGNFGLTIFNMATEVTFKEVLYRSVLKRPGEREAGDEGDDLQNPLRHRAVDWFYYALGVFTHLYGGLISLFFLFHWGARWAIPVGILEALEGPYFACVGVYVILKEIEKRRHHRPGRHWGELFVGAWVVLLFAATAMVFFSSSYHFDVIYKIILANSLVTLVVYLGGVIHRP